MGTIAQQLAANPLPPNNHAGVKVNAVQRMLDGLDDDDRVAVTALLSNTSLSAADVAGWLNDHGYLTEVRAEQVVYRWRRANLRRG